MTIPHHTPLVRPPRLPWRERRPALWVAQPARAAGPARREPRPQVNGRRGAGGADVAAELPPQPSPLVLPDGTSADASSAAASARNLSDSLLLPTHTPAHWRLAFQNTGLRASGPQALEVTGDLPDDLEGTFYRNGPGDFVVFGRRVDHFADADGMVHAIRIAGGQVVHTSDYVATRARTEEQSLGRAIYGGLGNLPTTGWSGRRRGHGLKNPANTSIIYWGDRLLAMYEAGRPHGLDPVTLQTLGEETFGGMLGPGDWLCAHPKRRASDNSLWGFGASFGLRNQLHVYRIDASGCGERRFSISLKFPRMIHDWALVGDYAFIPLWPMGVPAKMLMPLLAGRIPPGDAMRWLGNRGTEFAVVNLDNPRQRFSVRSDAFMGLHVANAFEDSNRLYVDMCCFPSGEALETLGRDLMRGHVDRIERALLHRLTIEPPVAGLHSGRLSRFPLSSTPIEFPRVSLASQGQSTGVVFGSTWEPGCPMPHVPVRIDLASGEAHQAPLAQGESASECIVVPKRDGSGEYVETLVYNPRTRRTELRVYDGANLAAGHIAAVHLPVALPFSFHCNHVLSRDGAMQATVG